MPHNLRCEQNINTRILNYRVLTAEKGSAIKLVKVNMNQPSREAQMPQNLSCELNRNTIIMDYRVLTDEKGGAIKHVNANLNHLPRGSDASKFEL